MMKPCWLLAALAIAIAVALPVPTFAQGAQTGTVTGVVRAPSGEILAGVTVTAGSPSLQGVRSTVTDANGFYVLAALPPGLYTVRFELTGIAARMKSEITVRLGGVTVVDAILAPTVIEVVEVVATDTSLLATPTGLAHFTGREIDALPVGRVPFRIAELAPGLTDNVPNAGQLTISGGFAYDNVFMIDGVDVNDNIFGAAHTLFIEEAIDETQVLTSGISAEYGRFSGGVINLVTKSGGNSLSGSIRLNLTNPAWSAESPLDRLRDTEHADTISSFLEGTLGGPMVRDRLWFFFAGRRERSEAQHTVLQRGDPFVTSTANDRYDVKLTGTPAPGHTLQGSLISNQTDFTNLASLNPVVTLDTTVLIDRQTPNRLLVASYAGVIGARTFVTGQYSEKRWGARGHGGTSTAIEDSPFRTRGALGVPAGLHYHAPFFSALDPEDRNNRQFAGSLTTSFTTGRTGSHSLKTGAEHFTSSRQSGGSQSSTGYVFQSDYRTTAAGLPAIDGQGRLIPRFVPGVSRLQDWQPVIGAKLDVTTLSFYVQDRWAATSRLSFDLGVRAERVWTSATGGITGTGATRLLPRLGMTIDPSGSGQTVFQATYAHYSGKYSDLQYGRNTNVGAPSLVVYGYTGPEGEGFDFAAGMDPANYTNVISGNFPTSNVFFEHGLASALTREVTLSAGRSFRRGYGRVMYTWRRASQFIDDFVDDPSAAGKVTVVRDGVDFGTFDRLEFRNSTDIERRYQAVQVTGGYAPLPRLSVSGHYTIQIRNHGNFEGEVPNLPASPSEFGDWPEILRPDRNFPSGRLNDFQRHKIRLWAIQEVPLGRAGAMTVAPLWRYNSAQTYSLLAAAVPLSATQIARNPGYARLPGGGTQTLYFGERGTETFAAYGLFDLAATYDVPLWRTVRPWIKLEVFNALGNETLIAWNTTLSPDPSSPLDADGLPIGYTRSAAFGTARSDADFPRPLPGIDGGRTFQVALGLRF